ncbi:TIR domain-containing protein [Pantoea ananatis]|uniref:TIR domain-containing protein n=1 Tax=Pantoea ananas TaxID=553 RepID=UPI000B7EF401|nr:TIR domain-containing protein [Pantoea ananatis]
MTKRNCFYSFHYIPDNWRVATVRSIGAIDGNTPTSDNNWETVKKGGDAAIKKWIADEMYGKSCIVVLVGSDTANRKWINHEIIEGWNNEKGVVGIYIHGLKDSGGNTSTKGDNPFDYIGYGDTGKKLSAIVKCYNPTGSTSQEKYNWIKENLAIIVEDAITIRKNN